jgi:glycosyltransferase involved in cell wall biosynthesis
MRVLHINSYYSTRNFYYHLYEAQLRLGLSLDVYVPIAYQPKIKIEVNDYTKVVINHHRFDRYFFHLKHYKILNDIQKQYAINEYSVFHAHSLFSNGYIAWKLKQKYGIPYIVAVRSSDVNTFFKKMIHLRKMGVNILRDASFVIFLSESYRQTVINHYIPSSDRRSIFAKSHVIPNGIDKFWLTQLNKPKILNDQQVFSMIQVGLVNANKNQITMIKVLDQLLAEGYKVKLTIVGAVEDQNLYRTIVSHPSVDYQSTKSHVELLELYRNSDVFVLPSINETFGLVYAEALSQGLPVIYTRGQGFDQQFADGEVGYPVDCFDVQDIINKIKLILDNYQTISQTCINSVSKFDWTRIAKEYDDLYRKIKG